MGNALPIVGDREPVELPREALSSKEAGNGVVGPGGRWHRSLLRADSQGGDCLALHPEPPGSLGASRPLEGHPRAVTDLTGLIQPWPTMVLRVVLPTPSTLHQPSVSTPPALPSRAGPSALPEDSTVSPSPGGPAFPCPQVPEESPPVTPCPTALQGGPNGATSPTGACCSLPCPLPSTTPTFLGKKPQQGFRLTSNPVLPYPCAARVTATSRADLPPLDVPASSLILPCSSQAPLAG